MTPLPFRSKEEDAFLLKLIRFYFIALLVRLKHPRGFIWGEGGEFVLGLF